MGGSKAVSFLNALKSAGFYESSRSDPTKEKA